jgi:7-carboxy-7-deazaguanine synthase
VFGPTLRIAEIFSSIQGEGSRLGTPSTFIRFSGCNLRCIWCDTPYASWSPEGKHYTIAQLMSRVAEARCRDVVVTGGEPMLFPTVELLCNKLREADHYITIETAGTVYRTVECDLMSISPKLANSNPNLKEDPYNWNARHEATRTNLEPLRRLIETYTVQLKFVVTPESGNDLAEIEALLANLPGVPPDQIHLMPEGRDVETLRRRAQILVPQCLAKGWRLTPRYQIDLFGDTRNT